MERKFEMPSSLIIEPTKIRNFDIIQTDNIQIFSFLNQPSLTKSSKEIYEKILRGFFSYFIGSGIKSITSAHITIYLNKLEKSSSTKNLNLRVLGSFFNYLKNAGYIDFNPTSPLKQEKVADKFRFKILDRDQIQRMIDLEEDQKKKLLLKILYYTGLRISEAIALKKDSFRDGESGGAFMTVIGKGTKVRTVFLPEDFFNEILNYTEKFNIENGYLFFDNQTLKQLSRFQALRIVKTAAKKAKVNPLPSPHWFRHSSATHTIEAGAPIHVVQATLGHASIATTGKYLHASKTESNVSYLFRESEK